MHKYLIYAVDDEKDILDIIEEYMTKKGFDIMTFQNAHSFFEQFDRLKPDVVILDIMLPDMDGYEICRRIRKSSDVPIIMLSAKDDELDKVVGLELGSDDYISKPFSLAELEARVKRILRRVDKESFKKENILDFMGIRIDFNQKTAFFDQQQIDLSPKEFDTFSLLIKERAKVLKRSYILENVWGDPSLYDERMVDDVIKRIRKKIAQFNLPIEIKTMWGLGYKLEGKKDENS